MNKKQIAENVIKAVKESGYGYKVLDDKGDQIRHLRIIDLNMDVWPSTGTIRYEGKFYKSAYKRMCEILNAKPEDKQPSKYELLEKRVRDLEEIVSHMMNDQEMSQHFVGGIYNPPK
tara:strand:+ start:5233 stop:5583 length:351 start_codon:yes stop_codon:yes gene_type:complete